MKSRIIFLTGPTASGKTAVSVMLARKINAEIICCDSMQVYKGMEILSCMPSLKERQSVVHHCMGFVPVTREYDVSKYRAKALVAVRAIIKKGKVPLFVGGTGLYISAMLDGIFDKGKGNEDVRRMLYRQIERHGSAWLHERLSRIDPYAAGKIHPNDARRIVRALEVYKVTGMPISELQKNRRGLADEFDVRVFCLDVERAELYSRIDERVGRMARAGVVAEVSRLLKKRLSRTASFAIGIREIGAYLRGDITLEEALSLMKKNTRNYARRQLTWFRKDKRIEWVAVFQADTPAAVCRKIMKRL